MINSKPFVLVLNNTEFVWFCREINSALYEEIASYELEPKAHLTSPQITLKNSFCDKNVCRFSWKDEDYYESEEICNGKRIVYNIWRFESLESLIEQFPEIGNQLFLSLL